MVRFVYVAGADVEFLSATLAANWGDLSAVLTPLRITWRDPVGLGSADSAGACRCDDGCEYVLKDAQHHPQTPHNEFFCTRLAEAVLISCPPCAVIDEGQGNYLFGSRWEGGLVRDKWWDMVVRGEIDLNAIAPALSSILAFDHFVHNDDRHLNNYIVRESRNGHVVLAFDFSRAWLYHGFPQPSLPFHALQKTRRAFRALTSRFGNFLDVNAVNSVLQRLSALDVQTVHNIVGLHPPSWVSPQSLATIYNWWQSPARQQRIDGIAVGIGNGTYL